MQKEYEERGTSPHDLILEEQQLNPLNPLKGLDESLTVRIV